MGLRTSEASHMETSQVARLRHGDAAYPGLRDDLPEVLLQLVGGFRAVLGLGAPFVEALLSFLKAERFAVDGLARHKAAKESE